ncbi:Alpha/Beta hydrolase protein, partial [Mycena leptocephala]
MCAASNILNDFVQYSKYSSLAYKYTSTIPLYKWMCPRPLGNTLVRLFEKGRTQGFVARDDNRGEIVVSFRGTFSLKDAITDARAWLTPFNLPGIAKDPRIRVHKGFLLAYKDVSDDVRTIVKNEFKSFPTYRIVVTGHSLGGAIASIAALSLKTEFPHTTLQLYTFGQPRVGTKNFARHVENTIRVENIFRAVHNLDGVPMVPRIAYEHFATEYWQS